MKKHLNGSTPHSVLPPPGAKRSEVERSETERSVVAGGGRTSPNPEVVPRAKRRQFTAEYKKRILAEAGAATEPGAIGAMIRREGLYSSHLTHWRQQRDLGLSPHRRGPKPKHNPLAEEVRKLKQQNGHLTQCLARAELIIDVQKKVSLLLGIPLAAVNDDGTNL